MSARRKINEFLEKLRILTPDSVNIRWRTIDTILRLLLEKRDRKISYRKAYIRNKDVVRKIRKPTSVDNIVRMLLNFRPQILEPLDEIERPPQTHFSANGILTLEHEIGIWNEIFSVTDEYDLLKPLIQVLSQRLDEIDRYMQGSDINESETK